MVDFSLTDADKRLVALAREEAAIGLTHSRYYDKHEDEIEPKVFPDVAGRPDPLEVLDEIEGETSGRVIAELLVLMETARGDVRMRRIKHHLGDKIVNYAGTEKQRELFGHKLLSIAMTEPGAGSDLASLSTRATLEGDHLVVRGHKIWTTWAHHSDWMYALVRTDPDIQPRQAGISFLLIDLRSPGIRIRPIKTIAGDDEFSEVFFDDVIVPAENLVGKLNDGWRIANALLGHERLASSNPQFPLMALERIKTMARASGVIADPAFQDRLAAASINVTALSALFSHAVELTNNERSPGPEASVIKIFASELLQTLNELLVQAAGGHASTQNPITTNFGVVDIAAPFLQSRRVTIYGGSSEIQRNVLARRVLNLPS